MDTNINFKRFDKETKADGFVYRSTDKTKDLDSNTASISMQRVGFNIHTVIENFMAEPVLLGGNLRVTPTRIKSLRRDDARLREDSNNYVIITIYSSENNTASDPRKRTTHTSKTEIRIPGKMLNRGSVFIGELDCYIMTESQVDATRELIARDVSHHGWDSINIPDTMSKQDPATIYVEFKELAQACIRRQDKITIRVGVDLEYGIVPDIIKNFRVSIMDSYFIPYTVYKLVYDPTLNPDEFVIDNLHMAVRNEFRSTFTELSRVSAMYLDHDTVPTLFGTFYGMGIFVNETAYLNYVHQRKTQERFRDETLYVAERSGDPRLKEEIVDQASKIASLTQIRVEQDIEIDESRKEIKRLKADVRARDETIDRIRKNYDAKMSTDAVLGDITNDQKRLQNEELKIELEREDLKHKEKTAPFAQKAVFLKNVSEIMKSGWGIVAGCVAGVATVLAVCKKYNIRFVMGA